MRVSAGDVTSAISEQRAAERHKKPAGQAEIGHEPERRDQPRRRLLRRLDRGRIDEDHDRA